ncbi:MAG: ATP-binding protein, partial [Myxococcota bacterium]
LVDQIDDLLLIIDRDSRILRLNRTCERWGLDRVEHIVGRKLSELFPGVDGESVVLDVWSRYETLGFPEHIVESEALDPRNNRILYVRLRRSDELLRTLDPEDRVRGPLALVTVRDTTELRRRQIEDERAARFDATRLVQRSVAHELGNPLAALKLTMELLGESVTDKNLESVETYGRRAQEVARRLEEIVERTLSQDGLAHVKPVPVDANVLLVRANQLFRGRMRQAGIRFEVNQLDQDVQVYADVVAASEVLNNLLENAMRATPAHGRVQIVAQPDPSGLTLGVRDTGHGIPEEEIASVLLPFETSKSQGLGLGIAYSAYLMKRMGGSLRIESEVGRGTEVLCRFSLAAAA